MIVASYNSEPPFSTVDTIKRRQQTERHLDLLSNALDTHKGECNNGNDRNRDPFQIVNKGKRKSEKVKCNTLLEVNSVWIWTTVIRMSGRMGCDVQEVGIGVLAILSIDVS